MASDQASDVAPEPAEGIEQIDRQVIQLFALVGDGIAGATHALLAGDREAARALVARDEEVDALYRQIERLVHEQLASAPVGSERQRHLIAVLGVLPELERSGDLAEHVARRAVRGMATEMSARARGLVERMGEVASTMWRMVADAYGNRVPDLPERLDEFDDEMDELHRIFTAELASGSMSLPVVIESVLIGRFYERLGDHAVNIARRLPVLSPSRQARLFEGPGDASRERR